jgi:xylan 1,4-beta-xylosidase
MRTRATSDAARPAFPRGIRTISSAPVLTAAAIGVAALTGTQAASAQTTLTVNAGTSVSGNPHFWSHTFGTGKAHLALRTDWQTHYKIGNRELGAQRVRGHGLLNDEMGLYKGAGSYDWTNLDTYLNAISLANMRPVIETDFMPTALGISGDKSPPSSYTNWNNFIKALVQHCVDKFGASDVANWYFEVWNEPDYAGFWQSSSGTAYTMSDYYTLYDNTAGAITSVVTNALVGGPSTTGSGPVAAFLSHVKSSGARIAFASNHNYPGGSATGTAADANSLVGDNNNRVSAITGAGYTTANVKSFNTEWNSSYSGQGGQVGDATMSMDNHWNVGFILKGSKLLADKTSGNTPAIEAFSYWVLTDVFDEDGGTDGIHMTSKSSGNTPFDGVFGVMTFQGMRKAAFNAFKLLNYTGTKRYSVTGGSGTSDGIDAMATSSDSGDELQIVIFNYYKALNTASGSGDSVALNVTNLPAALANKSVWVTQFLVDETHSNPYSVWAGQSKPASPSETQWQAMRAAQHLSVAQQAKQTVTTSFSATFSLKKQAGTLFLIGVNRPVTGRNAMIEIEGEDYDGQSSATKEDSGDSTTLGQSISIASGGSIFYDNVDFSDSGVNSVQVRAKGAATLDLRADSASGTSLGTCAVNSSSAWATQTCNLTGTTGIHNLYVVPSAAVHLNWMKFTQGGGGGQTGTGGAGNGGAPATGGAAPGGAAPTTGGRTGVNSTGGAPATTGGRTGVNPTGGAPATTGGRTGVSSGGAMPTGGYVANVGGAMPTGGYVANAGGAMPTGGYVANAGGAMPTGGYVANAGGAMPTGGYVANAGGAMPTGGVGAITSGGANAGDVGGNGTVANSSAASDNNSGGCGCRVSSGNSPSKLFALALGAVLAFRRRRGR